MLNEPYVDKDGQPGYKNDMSIKGFDVTIETGGSFAMQREAALQQLQDVMQIAPPLAAALMDKYAENLDLENMPDIVKRIQEVMLGTPIPQIISKETGMPIPPPPPMPPNPQMMAVQQKAQQAQMDMEVHAKQQEIDEQKLTLQSQQMVQDAIDAHAKNATDVMAMNQKMQSEIMKSQTELQRAHMGHKTDLVKHMSALMMPKERKEKSDGM